MQWVSKLFLLIVPFTIISCIQDYEMEFDDVHKNLSVVAELDPRERVEVLVAISKAPNQYGEYKTPSDASVILKKDGEFWDSLRFISHDTLKMNGAYISDKKLSYDSEYQIEVNYQHYPTVKASQKIPEQLKVSEYNIDVNAGNVFTQSEYPAKIRFLQNVHGMRYYAFRHFLNIEHWIIDQEGNRITENRRISILQTDDYTGFRDFRGYRVIESQDISEINFTLNINIEDLAFIENIENINLATIVEELSADAYLYRKTLRNKNDDYYGELFRVYGNLSNGYGIFSSKVSRVIRKRVL